MLACVQQDALDGGPSSSCVQIYSTSPSSVPPFFSRAPLFRAPALTNMVFRAGTHACRCTHTHTHTHAHAHAHDAHVHIHDGMSTHFVQHQQLHCQSHQPAVIVMMGRRQQYCTGSNAHSHNFTFCSSVILVQRSTSSAKACPASRANISTSHGGKGGQDRTNSG